MAISDGQLVKTDSTSNRLDLFTINDLAVDGSPDGAADYVMAYDASAGEHKKVLLNDLPGGGGGGGFSSAASAYMSSNQSISTDTVTKVQFNTEHYDNDSEYDPTTNYRFTANASGKYHVSASVYWTSIPAGWFYTYIFKNGTIYKYVLWQNVTGSNYYTQSVSADVPLDASDYVEIDVMQDTGSSQTIGSTSLTNHFSVHRTA